jgi:hypothetical protein
MEKVMESLRKSMPELQKMLEAVQGELEQMSPPVPPDEE